MIGKLENILTGNSVIIPERRHRKVRRNVVTQRTTLISPECKCCSNESLTRIRVKGGQEVHECESCGYVYSDSHLNGSKDSNLAQLPPPPSISFLKRALSWLPNKKQHIMVYSYKEDSIAEYLKSKGHEVAVLKKERDFDDPAADYNFPFRAFDIICCYHSLDFITEPLNTIKKLLQHLKPDGLLVIHTDFEAIDLLMIDRELDSKRCSYFRYSTFERMFDKLKHHIIYRSKNAIIVRKGI